MDLRLFLHFCQNMGARYVLYRMRHEVEKKMGALKNRHPSNLQAPGKISLIDWKSIKNPFVIEAKESLLFPKNQSRSLQEKAEKILTGQLQFFSSEWFKIGLDYNWLTNPGNGYVYDNTKHWSEIPDFSETAGDIKYVWEKSRFSYLLTLIRYDFHFDQDLSEFVFSEIDSWIEANPINKGPNWRCSQEISLRVFNWCYALYYYQNSSSLTEERWQKIQNIIYASLHHVYHHINFSRIAVRNNHAITETLFLSISNMLFPFIPETIKWAKHGMKWFEQEIEYQIYEDGTFLQFSMNYHRVVVQLLSFGIAIQHKNNKYFSDIVYQKAYKTLDFLYQCIQEQNGWLPNYGLNDGALFFPLTDTDFRDFRPQLNTLHQILTGKDLFSDDVIREDSLWTLGKSKSLAFNPLGIRQGVQSFVVGGYYLCRNKDYFTFIRCGNHKDRPAQADNLHVDVWYHGANILRDSGTYKYNAQRDLVDYFMGSQSHNVVTINNLSQMLKGNRFIWYYWSQKIRADWQETDTSFVFSGEIRAFQFLNQYITHSRKIVINKQFPQWLVTDQVSGAEGLTKQQIWHPNGSDLFFESGSKAKYFKSYNSNCYGIYSEEKSIYFDFNQSITTLIHYISK